MILKTDQQIISELNREIRRTHKKLMKLYIQLDGIDYIDLSYCKLWLSAQQDLFDPDVDTSKPYWVK
jgi:hypothetical protein